MGEIKLCPKWNRNNKQVSFDLPKLKLSKEVRDRLPNLKFIKLNTDNFEF
jgi:hypothetical protein